MSTGVASPRRCRFARNLALTLALALGSACPAVPANDRRAPSISELGPTFRSAISNIALAPDGTLWIEEDDGVARLTRDGQVTEIRQPDDCPVCCGSGIGIGPNRSIWKNGGTVALRLRGNAFDRFAQQGVNSDRSESYSAFAVTPDGVYLGTTSGTVFALRGDGNLKTLLTESGAIKHLAAGPAPAGLWIDPGGRLDYLGGDAARRNLAQGYFASRAILVMAVARDGSLVAIVQEQNPEAPPGGSATIVRVATSGEVRELATLPTYDPWRKGGITVAADGTIWFTEPSVNRVASIGIDGVKHEVRRGIPDGAIPTGIAADGDGSVWFTDAAHGQVDHLERSGHVRIIGSGLNPNNMPGAPIATRDGAIWFVQTLRWHPRVTRIASDGSVRQYQVGENLGDSLRATNDGVVYRTGDNTPSIAFHELRPDGSTRDVSVAGCLVTTFNVACLPHPQGHPPLSCAGAFPTSAVLAPDGNIWYTDAQNGAIGRISPDGRCRTFSHGVTWRDGGPQYLTVGPNRTLWFTDVRDRIGAITLDGRIREYWAGIPQRSSIGGIVAAPDGNVWFTLYRGNELARMQPGKRIERFRKGIYPSTGSDYGPDSVPSFDRRGRIIFNEPQGGRIARAVI